MAGDSLLGGKLIKEKTCMPLELSIKGLMQQKQTCKLEKSQTSCLEIHVDMQRQEYGPIKLICKTNTSLAAPGALTNRLQRRTARKANEANLDPPNQKSEITSL